MAINKNHEFEELDGIKCAIVERNVTPGRVEFLKRLLEYNGYTVIVTPTPEKPAPPPKPASADQAPGQPVTEILPPPPPTFTIGVTHVAFNAVNAIFGRLLKTPDGHVVTQAYWQQKEAVSNDEVPYYEK